MDIQICQCCGIIIRGKSKFCTGCGTTISKFSPITLPVISHTAAPLAVTLDPDPLVLERTMVKMRYAHLPAAAPALVPGGSDGNGGYGAGDGNGHQDGNGHAQEVPPDTSGQAASQSTSRLQNILSTATTRNLSGAGAGVAGMFSYEEEEPGAAAAVPEEMGAVPETQEFSAAPPSDYAQPQQPQGIAPPHSATFNRIVTTAGAFDALAGSTAVAAASIPVTVTTALSPGLDAGAVIATNLSAAPSMVPITSAEPPAGSPAATSYANATTYVAPATGSPENVPLGQSAPQPQEQAPAATAQPEFQAAAPADAITGDSRPPFVFESEVSSPIQGGTPAPAAPGPDDFFAAAPSSSPPAVETAPPAVTPAEAPAELNVAPPTVSNTPPQPEPAITVQPPAVSAEAPAPAVTAPPSTQPAPALQAAPSSFDFFAAQNNPFPAVPSSAEAAAPQLGAIVTPTPAAPKEPQNVIDAKKFSNGVPSVVQDAIRAAASASQTSIPKVSSGAPSTAPAKPEDKTRVVTDEERKAADGDRNSENLSEKAHARSRPKRDDEEDDDDNDGKGKQDKEPEKMLRFAGIEMKMKTALTVAILVVFLGFPITTFIFGLIGKAVSGIAGGGGSNMATIPGDWSMGVLMKNGQGRGTTLKGTVNFQQKGSVLSGNGVDNYGYFAIANGSVGRAENGSQKVVFQKIYIDEQRRPKGKPITYAGVVDWVNPDPAKSNAPFFAHMYGQWQFQKAEGFGWRARVVNRQGQWEAGQIRVDTSGSSDITNTGGPPPILDLFAPLKAFFKFPDKPHEYASFFARIAGILLLMGLGIVLASVKLFGPAGLLNIWAKKEYIPSQFKTQHYKMVSEFGKPLKAGGIPLGWRADWSLMKFWLPQKLALPPEVRAQNPHMLMLGAGSKGKSRLMASMIYHDIESNDRAVVVIDSDGGLIDHLMAKIAASPKGNDMAKRLIIIDPTHGGDVLAYNPLEFPDDGDLQNAASAIVFGFKAIYTEPPGSQSQWNQQTANILRNAAILLMANGYTLTDLPRLLSENDFRDVLLEKIEKLKDEKAEYTTLLEAWNQYKRLARTDQWINWVEPILNRVQPMLGDPRIRPILTKPKGDLNLKEIISEGKVLFVKVPQGQLDQNANLLGSLIVTGIKQAAMSLSLKGSSRKHQCALYLDEFDSFIEKETFDAITSETKKFQIGFIGCSKTLQGLPEDYRNQIVINVGTMCCFALAKKDGDILGPSMFRVDGRKIKHQTLQNIFNKVNTAPQFELISDEEKLNIDRVVGQEERHYFCYRVGTVAGVFNMKAPDFNDVPDKDVNWTLIDQVYARSVPKD